MGIISLLANLATIIGLPVAFWQIYKTKEEVKEIRISYNNLSTNLTNFTHTNQEGNTTNSNINTHNGDFVGRDKNVRDK
jgi:LPS sulfotransferase NodH